MLHAENDVGGRSLYARGGTVGDLAKFQSDFNISKEEFDTASITWDELLAIMADYDAHSTGFRSVAESVANRLLSAPGIHSVKYRVKDREHVAAKIVRKNSKDNRGIDLANYKEQIGDFIGVRAMHLFKDEWAGIHKYIGDTWIQSEEPIAYYRQGDPKDVRESFEKEGCKTEVHKYHYRSVHYGLLSSPTRAVHRVELQVRTVFEEGWAEVDHRIRYPNHMNHPVLLPQLVLLNGLAGYADEMAVVIQQLKQRLEEYDRKIEAREADLSRSQEQLDTYIEKFILKKEERDGLMKELEKYRAQEAKLEEERRSAKLNALDFSKGFEDSPFSYFGTAGVDQAKMRRLFPRKLVEASNIVAKAPLDEVLLKLDPIHSPGKSEVGSLKVDPKKKPGKSGE